MLPNLSGRTKKKSGWKEEERWSDHRFVASLVFITARLFTRTAPSHPAIAAGRSSGMAKSGRAVVRLNRHSGAHRTRARVRLFEIFNGSIGEQWSRSDGHATPAALTHAPVCEMISWMGVECRSLIHHDALLSVCAQLCIGLCPAPQPTAAQCPLRSVHRHCTTAAQT